MSKQSGVIGEILAQDQDGLLGEWLDRQTAAFGGRKEHASAAQLREQSAGSSFRRLEPPPAQTRTTSGVPRNCPPMRELLNDAPAARARQGFTPARDGDFRVLAQSADLLRATGRAVPERRRWPRRRGQRRRCSTRSGSSPTEFYQKGREQVIFASAGRTAGALDAGRQRSGTAFSRCH